MNSIEEKRNDLIVKIRVNLPLRDYMFRKLASGEDPVPWLELIDNEGYFDPKNYILPKKVDKGYMMPSWNVLDFLKNVSLKNAENPNSEITERIVKIIDRIIEYPVNDRNYKIDSKILEIIFCLPQSQIKNSYFDFIEKSLKTDWDSTLIEITIEDVVIPTLLKNKSIYLPKVLGIILSYRKESDINKYHSIVDEYWLKRVLKENISKISKICRYGALNIVLDIIDSIIQDDYSQFDNIWIPAIEDNSQNEFTERYQFQLVKFVRDLLEQSKPVHIRGIISKLKRENHPIFKRIAIHIINYFYDDLGCIFWHWNGNPLDDYHIKHEVFIFFENRANLFSKPEIMQIMWWINSKKYYVSDELKNDDLAVKKIEAYQKKGWLYSILKTGDLEVNSQYEKYDEINPKKLDHPDFDIYFEFFSGDKSPVSIDYFRKKSNSEIAECLIKFKEIQSISGPSVRGLAKVFNKYVESNPYSFSNDLDHFLDIPNVYKEAFLRGLYESWVSGVNDFAWDYVLDFILRIISEKCFWESDHEDLLNNKDLVILRITDIIEAINHTEDYSFNSELLNKMQNILKKLYDCTVSHVPNMGDTITAVLNSPRGGVFSAMIVFSVRCSNLQTEYGWNSYVKSVFEENLKNNSIEFSVNLGKYFPYLFNLDQDWVSSNIDGIFPDNDFWKYTFDGYLFYSSKIFKEVIFVLKEHGDYKKAIKTDFKDNNLTQKLILHLSSFYLYDLESLESDSLIQYLVDYGSKNKLYSLINFFWMQREKNSNLENKIIPLWDLIFNKLFEEIEIEDNQKIISKLSRWLSLVDKIDETVFNWLKISIEYMESHSDIRLLIEYLSKHVENNSRQVGDLFILLLKNNHFNPHVIYNNEDIGHIVMNLYKFGHIPNADSIVNFYRRNGNNFLRDIYEDYRS